MHLWKIYQIKYLHKIHQKIYTMRIMYKNIYYKISKVECNIIYSFYFVNNVYIKNFKTRKIRIL